MAIRGVREARSRTRKIFKGIGVSAEKSVVEILIAGRSFTMLLVPIDTGNLANSAFIDTRRSKNGVFGRFGFTASYAAAVHGMPGKLKGQPRGTFGTTRAGVAFGGGTGSGNYWDPDAEPEFVTKGFEDNVAAFDAIVARNMKR